MKKQLSKYLPVGLIVSFLLVTIASILLALIVLDPSIIFEYLKPYSFFGGAQKVIFFCLAVYYQADWIKWIEEKKGE